VISRGVVLRLGVGQLVCWGSTFYLIGAFGDRIAADFGWSLIETQAGFSISLLAMGVVSTTAGRMIDRHGGRAAMVSGSLLAALGCAALACAVGPISYGAAWIVLGVAMRLCLYDAAFAALARIAGPEARRAMSQITLFGGLASTVFWPLGAELADVFGWRAACLVFAACALLTAPLHWTIPQGRFEAPDRLPEAIEPAAARQAQPRSERPAAILFATVVALSNALHYGMSAHIIGVLGGLGVAAGATAWIAALRGVGQSGARLCEVLFGRSLRPVDLNLAAAAGVVASFVLGFWSGASLATAAIFSLIYGAATGLLTITRGTLPLALFDPARYGVLVGRLIAPSFVASAAAPVAYGAAIERYGASGAIWLSLALGAGALGAAAGLKRLSLRLGR